LNNANNKRIMAIDYGDARTGVAVSDESATLVGDAWVVHATRMHCLVDKITSEAIARGVALIVIGYPKNMDGTIGPRAEKSEQLSQQLRQSSNIETVLWDERLTTMQAGRILTITGKRGIKRKNTIDAIAASLILEGYISAHRRMPEQP